MFVCGVCTYVCVCVGGLACASSMWSVYCMCLLCVVCLYVLAHFAALVSAHMHTHRVCHCICMLIWIFCYSCLRLSRSLYPRLGQFRLIFMACAALMYVCSVVVTANDHLKIKHIRVVRLEVSFS